MAIGNIRDARHSLRKIRLLQRKGLLERKGREAAVMSMRNVFVDIDIPVEVNVSARAPIDIRWPEETAVESQPVVVAPNLKVAMVIDGSSEIFKSLFFLQGLDVDYKSIFENNIYIIFNIWIGSALKIIKSGQDMPANTGLYADEKAGVVVDESGAVQLPFKQSWGQRYTGFVDSNAGWKPLGLLSGELYEGVRNTKAGGGVRLYDIKGGQRFRNPYSGTKALDGLDLSSLEQLFRQHESLADQYIVMREFGINVEFNKPEYIGYVHNGKERTQARPFLTWANLNAHHLIQQYLSRVAAVANLENSETVRNLILMNPDELDTESIELMSETQEGIDREFKRILKKQRHFKLNRLIEAGSALNPRSKDYKYLRKRSDD